MRGPRGYDTCRRPLCRAAAGVGGTVAAAFTVLALAGAPPFGAGPERAVREPEATASPFSPVDTLRPAITLRDQWGADPRLLDQKPRYADGVHAVVIHHTGHANDYDCSDSPHLVREIYATHAVGKDWGDIGYNFLVDKCGTIFEGRLGGVDRAVVGAHTIGLNRGTAGIAAIGTYTEGVRVPKALRESVARLVAWKLGLTGAAPGARARLVSTNSSSRFPKGTSVTVPSVLGHIGAYETNCPGEALVRLLPLVRKEAARLQNKARVLVKGGGGGDLKPGKHGAEGRPAGTGRAAAG
ncbi:N-acetylmuramoyl-L-alanine amidase [Streptomyces sp. MAR4 CNX-425]|uniref:N-acetylmuramoyl-L-alanine amidase n=1 Tax=Streptomyces sp. MAR4 CNX-425 TaxID=3406343 RepID=UPI003B510457